MNKKNPTPDGKTYPLKKDIELKRIFPKGLNLIFINQVHLDLTEEDKPIVSVVYSKEGMYFDLTRHYKLYGDHEVSARKRMCKLLARAFKIDITEDAEPQEFCEALKSCAGKMFKCIIAHASFYDASAHKMRRAIYLIDFSELTEELEYNAVSCHIKASGKHTMQERKDLNTKYKNYRGDINDINF